MLTRISKNGTEGWLLPGSGNSWWIDQRPYYDSAVNRVQTGYAPSNLGTCPNPEQPNAALDFNVGDPVYFTTFYRDQLDTQTSTYRIYQPDGTEWTNWTHNSNAAHYSWSWWYWWWPFFWPNPWVFLPKCKGNCAWATLNWSPCPCTSETCAAT